VLSTSWLPAAVWCVPAGHDGRLISDRNSIASSYLRGWFWFDLLSSFPFEQVLFLHNSLPSLVMLLKVRCKFGGLTSA
jgi:hypothetical protein